MIERSRCLRVFPDFADFAAAAEQGNFVPVCAERLADLLTPVSAYLRVAGRVRRPFLLESAEGGEHIGRYSFLGGDPFLEVEGDAEGVYVAVCAGPWCLAILVLVPVGPASASFSLTTDLNGGWAVDRTVEVSARFPGFR